MNQDLQAPPAGKTLPPLETTLWRTSAPGFPVTLPCVATLTLASGMQAVCVGHEESGEGWAPATVTFDWNVEDLKEVILRIVPDAGDEIEPQLMREEHFSTLLIQHVDPYDVLPYLATAFRTTESYWFRVFAKELENRGVKVTVEETPPRRARKGQQRA